ncbi:phage tail tape measure protein [Streptomyces sp. NPDC012950]|uniref:phage tail tape measure protein n=1 Tax=Streptomyces sp. NPDC012950 TaxID=3364858 RepID=UPI0036A2AE81
MANVGYATLQIIPSVRGIGEELRRQLVGPAEDAGEQAGEAAGGGFGETFKGALAAIGVAEIASRLGEQFTEAFTDALEQSHVKKVLVAQLGSTGGAAAQQGKAVGKLFAQGVTENFEQGAEAVRQVVSGGLVPPGATLKQLELIGTRMTDVANTFGTDMTLQSKAVSAMLKNGVAKSAEEALDVITTGFQFLGPNAEDLLETFQEYSVQFRKLGIDAPTALGLFSEGLENGARDTDILADAMKEFSIRSIDMSDSSREAYKAMGLNAEAMEAQIGRGGDAARLGLAKVLDSLRAIHDPVKREAAAVGLFGTQAEDLGKALFALRPEITDGLEGTTGAAQRLGETLRSGPGHELTVFTRALKQGLVDFLGGQVIPVLMEWARVFTTYVMPPLTLIGQALSASFLPAASALTTVVAGAVNWFREWGVWLLPLGIAIGGVTLAMNLQAIATGAVTAVFAVYRGVILAGTAVTNGFAAAQTFLTAVMAANPIVLVITAIIALGAALVIAYKKSETFRNIVQATWEGLKTGWNFLWNSVLKPGFEYLMGGLRELGTAAMWLWTNGIKPAFSGIWTAGKILFAILTTLVIAPLVIAFKAFGATAMWLWDAALKPTFDAIVVGAMWVWTNGIKPLVDGAVISFKAMAAAALWLWANGIKPIFNNAVLLFKVVGATLGWLWTNAARPAFNGIVSGAKWLWTNGIKPLVDGAVTSFKAMGAAAMWLWTNAISPSLGWIGDKAKWLYGKAVKPAFDSMKEAARLLGVAFDLAQKGIGKAWDQIKQKSKGPVNFVIEWVYTKGIKATWDKVASFVGLDPLPAGPKLLAAGGTVGNGWGPAAPMKVNRPTAIVGEGNPRHPEYVIPTDPRYRGRARALWEAAGTQLMADGGIIGGAVDWLGGTAKRIGGAVMSGVDFLADPGKMWEQATAFVRDGLKGIGSSPWAQMLARVPGKMLGGLKDKLLDAAKGLFGGSAPVDVGGSGVQRWSSVVLQALRMVGQPASLLPVVLRRMNQESGGNPAAINNWDINAKNGTPSKGLMQVIDPTFNAHAGALRGRGVWDPLANIYASMRYALARYGSLTSAYNRAGGYANGGRPRRGELAWVGERGPELVRFGSGNTEVFDHERSMRMAAGLGILRGFAKGTKPTGSFGKQVTGRPLTAADFAAFTKALTGSASAIGTAAAQLAKNLGLASIQGLKLAGQVDKVTAKLKGLAAQRDAITSLIATAKEAAADQKKTASDFLGLSNLSSAGSLADLLTGMEDRQNTLTAFQSQIGSLSRRGLSQELIRQLVAMGPESPLAQMIVGGSASDIRRLNDLAKKGGVLAGSFGNSMADAMYDTGKNASKGFLTGLLGQQADLQAAMTRLGSDLIQSLKVGMGLAPKPTSVGNAAAKRAAAVAGRAATFRPPTAVSSGPRITNPTWGKAGDPVALRIGDREFVAYVEDLTEGVMVQTLVPTARAISGKR